MKRFLPIVCVCAMLTACGTNSEPQNNMQDNAAKTVSSETSAPVTSLTQIDMAKWEYNAEDNVYYQLNIPYCETPADENYDTLAIIVPAAYMTGEQNEDGTFACVLSDGKVNGYTAQTAPFVLPVETPGYAAQAEMTEYSSQKEITDAGLIYVQIGCRGREAGAPAGVTDLKAGIRYIRYNSGIIPGSTDRMFSYGMSGGGAQSALLGATGDSALYTPYLEKIGAVMGVSDAVQGSMCWCPITNLDTANEAYEWNMGVTRTGLDEQSQVLSDGLGEAYIEQINSMGLTDKNGNKLTLDSLYSGSYYDVVKAAVEKSLNNFLEDTQFPYDASASNDKGGFDGFGGGMGDMPKGQKPEGMPDMKGEKDFTAMDDISRDSSAAEAGVTLSGTYETAKDYIAALNANGEWVVYDEASNTAEITSVEDFTKALKPATKSVGAFDALDRSQGENTLFGYEGEGAHFDKTEAALLAGTEYENDFADDLAKTDALGTDIDTRINMYTPLYYLLESSEGYKSSTPAKYWRIRSGINQGDTSVTTELNLALALESFPDVKSVDFAQVWGQKHVKAERSGDSTANFVEWVNECLKSE